MKVRLFLDSVGTGGHARCKRQALRGFCDGIRQENADTKVVTGCVYEPCDVAVLFGTVGDGLNNSGRRTFRGEVLARHKGPRILLEAPIFGRTVQWRSPMMKKLHKKWIRLMPDFIGDYPYFRVGVNGFLADNANFANQGMPPDRWASMAATLGITVEPYRNDGRHVLLIGQKPGDESLRGLDILDWLHITATKLVRQTNRPIIVRPHPVTSGVDMDQFARCVNPLPGITVDYPPRESIGERLRNCWTLVTYSSSAAVDAIIKGIPCITLSPASFAWPVSDHDLESVEQPTLFDREQWFYDLAYTQWSPKEMRAGIVWRHLFPALTSSPNIAEPVS